MRIPMERWAAITGLGFAVLLVVSGFLPGNPAKWNAGVADVQSYLQGKHKEIVVAAGSGRSGEAFVRVLETIRERIADPLFDDGQRLIAVGSPQRGNGCRPGNHQRDDRDDSVLNAFRSH